LAKAGIISRSGEHRRGHPDFGLYAANQVLKGAPRNQPPERGVVEMKGVDNETWLTAGTDQVSKYMMPRLQEAIDDAAER
jgi:hypothetical protein